MTPPEPHRRGLLRFVRLPGRDPSRIARDVDDELRFHLEQRAAELRAEGFAPDAARVEAMRRFGNLNDTREYCHMMDDETARRERRRDWTADAWYDVRWSVRQMLRHPAFTLLAALTLAVGIGASTAMYSVVRRLLIEPLPVPGGDRMVVLVRRFTTSPLRIVPSEKLVDAWRGGVRAFEWVAALDQDEVVLSEGGDSTTLEGGSFETMLPALIGARPSLGRFFTDDEARPGMPPVAMLGWGLWQRRYGGDRGVVGRVVTIDGQPRTIVGVAPRDFELPFFASAPSGKEIWTPLQHGGEDKPVNAMAKLRPGATAEQASREMTAIMAELAGGDPMNRGLVAAALRPQDFLGRATRDTLVVTLGAVAVLLLIACANVANLLLARSIGRERELAIRAAVGAGRWRLMRQLLTESALLSVLGGALGLVVAWRGLDAIIALRPDNLVALDRVRLDAGVLGGALALALLTGILFGLAPAFLATEGGVGQSLRQGAGGASAHRRSTRLRAAFVTLELAMSVVLLVGAGLMVRSFLRLQRVDLGLDPRGLMSVQVTLPGARYPTADARRTVLDAVARQVAGLPGVRGAELALGLPAAAGAAFGKLEIEGVPAADASDAATVVGFNAVSPAFFRLVALRLREGRVFSADSASQDVIINATMAARYWPGQSAVGRRFRLGDSGAWSTVVGVVDDVRLPGASGSMADHQIYEPFFGPPLEPAAGPRETATTPQPSRLDGTIVLRADEGATDVLARVARAVAAIEPGGTASRLETMRRIVEARYVRPRFAMALLAAFALIAVVVAAVGLYGVIAFSVSRRMREMGIRLALGARPGAVTRLVLAEGARLAVIAVTMGLAGAAALTRLMQGLIYGISPLDPVTFIAVGATLIGLSLLASYGPARRAVRADPLEAMRSD